MKDAVMVIGGLYVVRNPRLLSHSGFETRELLDRLQI
jgi:hypothetical protein